MAKKISLLFLLILIICSVFAYSDFSTPNGWVLFDNASIANVNNSDFWDGLDTPSDIPNSEYLYNHTLYLENMYAQWFVNALIDDSMADTLHRHSELSASDGTPDRALVVDAAGKVSISNDLRVDTDLLFVDIAPGRVGIGITPATDFHVVGESIFMGGNVGIGTASPTYKFEVYDTTTTSMNVSDVLYVDGSNKRVGIGTTSPQVKLHIAKDSFGGTVATADMALETNSDSYFTIFSPADKYGGITFGDTGRWDAGAIYYNHSGDYIRIDTSGSERIRIDSSGNVGIGTDSPTNYKLEVKGGTFATRNSDGFQFHDSGNSQILAGYDGGVIFNGNKVDMDFVMHSDTIDNAFFLQGSSGNVGIGTTSPDTPLHIVSATDEGTFTGRTWLGYQSLDVATAGLLIAGYSDAGGSKTENSRIAFYQSANGVEGGDIRFGVHNGTSANQEAMRIDKDGNVGIGTDSPTNYKLEVKGGTFATRNSDGFQFHDSGNSQILAGYDGGVIFNGNKVDMDFVMHSDTIDNAFFLQGSSGNVGIGTTSPSALLDVAGSQLAGSSMAVNLSGVLYVNESNVGIGTTAPTHELNVVGDLNVTGLIINPAIYCESSELADQNFPVAGARYRLNISNVDEGNGISMSTGNNGTNITIDTSGVYHMVSQPQVKAGAGGAGDFHMWIEKNTGSGWADISDSNIELKLASLEEDVIVLATTLKLNQGDVLRFVASVSDVKIQLHAQSPAGEPVIPSIIFTMYRVGN